MRRCVTALFVVLSLSPAMLAQFEQGSIVGTVADPQSAPVPGATVQIRSSTTNVSREVTTTESGEYNSLPLPPGRYRGLRAAARAFARRLSMSPSA